MKKLSMCLLLLLPLSLLAQSNLPGRNRSVSAELERSASKNAVSAVRVSTRQYVDTLLTPSIPFAPMSVSMKGYSKHKNDEYESFILCNNTERYRISRVLIKLVYISTIDSVNFHNREVLVECDIQPGSTQMVNIKSFDKSKNYYHYSVPPARSSGIPYEVRYDVLRYDVVVE